VVDAAVSLAPMPKPNAKKRRVTRVKGVASRGFFRRRKLIWIVLLVLLLIPALQVAVVRFVDPPRTLPMWIDQVSSRGAKAPLRYRWIPLSQIPPRKRLRLTRLTGYNTTACFMFTC
jgi:hypothetical protein